MYNYYMHKKLKIVILVKYLINESSGHLLKAVRLDGYDRVKAILDVGGDPNTIPSSLEVAFTSRRPNSTKICKLLLFKAGISRCSWCIF